MKLNDNVSTSTSLPGIPAGSVGRVVEIGRMFVLVEFPNARVGYYTPQQLRLTGAPGESDERVALGVGGHWVPYGSHLCYLPASQEELGEVIAEGTAAGLKLGENCLCVLRGDWIDAVKRGLADLGVEVSEALASGQLATREPREMYLAPGEFTAEKQLRRTARVIASLVRRGSGRARLFACAGTAVFDLPEWWTYEASATPLLEPLSVIAVCTYEPAERGGEQWRKAEAVHPYVLKERDLVAGGASPS